MIYTPYVPRGDIDADDLLVQIPKNCSDKLLSDKLKRRCNACASRTTLKSCLATNAQTWHQSKGVHCPWLPAYWLHLWQAAPPPPLVLVLG